MLHGEQADVVPVLGDGEADVEAGTSVGILLEQLVGGGPVEPLGGADAEFAADAGVHEPTVDVGEGVDLLLLLGVDQRDAVFVAAEVGAGDEVVVVMLAAGRVDL